MKTKLLLILLSLFLVAGCWRKAEVKLDENPDDNLPQGTIVGNPRPPEGIVTIMSVTSNLTYVISIYKQGSASITEMEGENRILSVAQGAIEPVVTEDGSFLGEFEISTLLPRGKRLIIRLIVSVEQRIVGIRMEMNGAPVVVTAQFMSHDRQEFYEIAEIQGPEGGSCNITPTLDDLKTILCTKVHECRPSIDFDACMVQIEDVELSDEFGLAESPNADIARIRRALEEGDLQFNEPIYCTCFQRIEEISCELFGGYVSTIDELWELEEVVPPECGEDEYPGIFIPDEFDFTPLMAPAPELAVDQLVNALCTVVESCDPVLTYSECSSALEEGTAADIWDEFGLSGRLEGAPAEIIREGLASGEILVDATGLNECITEHLLGGISDSCDVSSGSLTNMENYADNCEMVFSESE